MILLLGQKKKTTGFRSLFFASNQAKVAKAMYTGHHIYNTFWGLLGLKDSSKNLVIYLFFNPLFVTHRYTTFPLKDEMLLKLGAFEQLPKIHQIIAIWELCDENQHQCIKLTLNPSKNLSTSL